MADENVTLTPTFIVYINGTRLGVEHEASVRQIQVKDQFNTPSTCRIILSDIEKKWIDSPDFELAQSVSVLLGFKDAVEEVFNGEITGSEVMFRKNADATLILNCSNKMHRLLKVRKHRVFNETTDADIIAEISSEYGLSADTDALSKEHVVRVQKDQYDFDFLRNMAREYNCKFWVQDDTLFIKSAIESEEDIVLEWGKTLVEFSSRRNTEALITQVEVVGWDNMTGEGFSGIAKVSSITDRTGNGELGAQLVEENFGERPLVIRDEHSPDQQSAEEKALSLLTDNSYTYVKASAVCEGNNRIRSGSLLEIKETGERFSGTYLVRKVLHNFHASSGYSTHCELERNTDV